jgi:hypothetical protein
MVLIGTLTMASAYAAPPRGPGSASTPALIDIAYHSSETRSVVPLPPDFSTSAPPMTARGLDAHGIDELGLSSAFPDGSGKVANADAEICRSGTCVRLLSAEFAAFGEHATQRATQRATNASAGMTLLDLGLMLVFGVALVAYQLERKQRLLRQSALIPTSKD